jgi:hypothetical protein
MTTFKDARSGSAITVKVTPKSKANKVQGVMDDGTIKIHITAPPEDGKANEMLMEFLAEKLGLKANQIEIVAGLSSERKLISLIGISPDEVDARLKPTPEKKPAKKKLPGKSKKKK